ASDARAENGAPIGLCGRGLAACHAKSVPNAVGPGDMRMRRTRRQARLGPPARFPRASWRARAASMTETQRSDVLISGGGLVGQTLALALAHHGLSSQVVDPADPVATIAPGFDGRASAIASATWQMFQVLGLADQLQGHGCAIRAIKVSDGGQAGELDFVTQSDDPALGVMIENRQLRVALAAAIADAPLVRLNMPANVTARTVDAHGVTLTLADGKRLAAPLL